MAGAAADRYGTERSPRRRVASVALAVAAHVLVIWLLLRLAPTPKFVDMGPSSASFTLLPDRPAGADAPRAATRAAPRAGGRPAPRRVATPPPPPRDRTEPPPPPPVEVKSPDPMLRLFGRKDLFAGADVARLRRDRGDELADAGDAAPGAGDSTAAYGPGEGPGGKRLFNAEWFREPTSSQLAPYIRPGAPRPGWGIVACQTVADYRVDNCRHLSESPVGSGYAGAVRQAAWQFRVRPPRVGGKSMVGAWVRIRIDYTTTGIK